MVHYTNTTGILEKDNMKHLKIEYNGIVLFDDEVAEISWQDNEGGVTVTGKTGKGGGSSIFDLLSAAARQQTENEVAIRKADLEAEKAMIVESSPAE